MIIGKDAQVFKETEFEMNDPIHEDQGRKMYKYRKFTIPPCSGSREQSDVALLVRVGIDAVRIVNNQPKYTIVRAMNEYDSRGGSYRIQLEKQPGALSAAEY